MVPLTIMYQQTGVMVPLIKYQQKGILVSLIKYQTELGYDTIKNQVSTE